ncbi:lysine-sensitive aspartokinase 3 [Ferrimonas marina]|uniref:Aspartokinase n=1 Tax=Ferrimonas marina TaxID=299255 RepID=A0A1M5Z624_9GAMM|nr:lysine-sensitive aspartokinase 3 [Ferrimonas marina]SHI19717.1 aspartate kinase [Ferrimonas marina]
MSQSHPNSVFSVAKFGGTSVADYAAMQRCAELVASRPQVRLVVVSASAGVTNALVALGNQPDAAERDQHLATIHRIQQGICEPLAEPAVTEQVHLWLDQLATLASVGPSATVAAWKDELLAYGERFSSLLFSRILNQHVSASCFDVRQVMRTDGHHGKAMPNQAEIRQLCQQHLAAQLEQQVVVTQGFVGADADGHTTTLGRGGSDYSAALLAAGLQANEVEIWTDVAGIYTTDPRLCPGARAIAEISFAEAAELATFGAKVLHPATLIPAVANNIAVFVGSSREPVAGGTRILPTTQQRPMVRAVALRRQQTLVTVHSMNMLHATGFLAEVFAILARHNLSVDLVTTSEVSIALTLDEAGSAANGHELLTEAVLAELGQLARVEVERDLALIAVIGNDVHSRPAVSELTFATVAPDNVRMICQGASPHNLCFLVNEAVANQVVQRVHDRFIDAA